MDLGSRLLPGCDKSSFAGAMPFSRRDCGGGFGPKAVQMLLIASLRIILDYFGPRAAQMREVISSGAILDHFGCPKKSTYFKWSALVSFWFQYSRSNPSKSIRIRQNPTRSADIRFGVSAAV